RGLRHRPAAVAGAARHPADRTAHVGPRAAVRVALPPRWSGRRHVPVAGQLAAPGRPQAQHPRPEPRGRLARGGARATGGRPRHRRRGHHRGGGRGRRCRRTGPCHRLSGLRRPRTGGRSRAPPSLRVDEARAREDGAVNARRKRLDDICGGMPTFPLAVLFLLFFFDEFDTAAFNILAPNIREAFHLTVLAFGTIVVVNLTIVLLLAVPVGYYGDRLPRRKLVIAGAVIAGVFSCLTGVAPVLFLLVLFRLANGVGRLLNDTIHTSLLADYYNPNDRPRVFGAHRNAVYFGTIVGSAVAGVAAFIGGWRLAFIVLIVPIVVTALLGATKLHEPVRGGTDDPDAALAAEQE